MRRVLKLIVKKEFPRHDDKLTRSLSCDTFKDIVDKAVQNSHCFVRDTGIGVDLLEDCQIPSQIESNKEDKSRRTLVDVRAVCFLSGLLSLFLFNTISTR